MKKLILMTLLTGLISSCVAKDEVEKNKSTYAMECERVSESARAVRCENQEAICYKSGFSYDAGISCYFKQSMKIKDGLDALSNSNDTSN